MRLLLWQFLETFRVTKGVSGLGSWRRVLLIGLWGSVEFAYGLGMGDGRCGLGLCLGYNLLPPPRYPFTHAVDQIILPQQRQGAYQLFRLDLACRHQ